jgi:hypothetical protein
MLCYVLENTQEICPPRVTRQDKKTLVRIIDAAMISNGIGTPLGDKLRAHWNEARRLEHRLPGRAEAAKSDEPLKDPKP